ncbi:MAG: hypothetical protein K9L89_03390, partial [Kiritimatiellales bacterium]|nr:hypothetical protein [Kiritimatiellales bacterium]
MHNGLFNAVRFAVYTLAGYLFIPFLVKQYGSASYGLIYLAGFLTQYIGLISGSVSSSIARFLNVALNKNDWQQANEIFSTAIVTILVFVCIQVPLFAFGIWKLDWFIAFPPELAADFKILVSLNVALFFVDIVKGVIFTPLYAANRLDVSAKFEIVSEIVRLTLLVVLILSVGAKLWIIGTVDLCVSLGVFTAGLSVYQKLIHHKLLLRRRFIKRVWIRPIMNMAGWSLVALLGQALFLKTDVLIINRFVGIELAGICAALTLWPNFLQQVAKNFTALIMPVIMIDYAHERVDRIRSTVMLVSRLYSIISLLACGLVMLLGDWLLVKWMDESYRQYQWLLILMMIHFPITLAREAIYPIFPAFNKMEYMGISQLVSGILNVVLSLAMVFLGYGLFGVIIATAVSQIIQRTFFLTYFACKLLEIPKWQFLRIYASGSILIGAAILQVLLFKGTHFYILGA